MPCASSIPFRCASATLVVGLALSACSAGGSSGGGSAEGVAPVELVLTADPASFETAEYRRSGSLPMASSSTFYAADASGTGVRMAMIDTGVDADHPQLSHAVASESTDVTGAGSGDPTHGTAVAGLMVARRDGVGMHGIAYGGELLSIRADNGLDCPDTCAFEQDDLATATDYAVSHDADIINYSLAGAGILQSDLRDALRDAVEADRLLVFAAGNAEADDPSYPGLFAASSAAAGRALIVGALEDEATLASFSNRAGDARNVYLAAAGVDIVTTADGGGQLVASGTSMAAPTVSGAAALLRQAAPHLSSEQIAGLLLSSAADIGEPGVDEVFGHGRLDLGAALAPQGALRVALGQEASGPSRTIATSGLNLGGAFGSNLRLKSAGGTLMALDALDRPFGIDLDELVAPRAQPLDLTRWWRGGEREKLVLAGDDADAELALVSRGEEYQALEVGFALGGGWHLRPMLASDADILSETSPRLLIDAVDAPLESAPSLALRVDRRLERARFALTLHHTPSGSRQTSTRGEGALDLSGTAPSSGLGLSSEVPLSRAFSLLGRAKLLATAGVNGEGIIRRRKPFISTRFMLGGAWNAPFERDGRLVLAVAQPLRAEKADLALDLPVARTLDGRILRQREHVEVSPAGREVDVELGYSTSLSEDVELGGNLMVRLAPEHDPERAPELVAAIRLSLPVERLEALAHRPLPSGRE